VKKLIVIFLLISSYCFSQSENNSEKTWLIGYYFKSEKQLRENLSLIFDLTMAGKYNDAKTEISQLKSTVQKSSLAYSALLCYEANICYNESNYNKSFTLADSAISIISLIDKDNRYIVKALNIKAKALSAINEFDSSEKILNETVQMAQSIDDKNGLASSYYLQNSNASDRGFYAKSKDLLLKSIALRKEIKDELGLAASYSFLGLTNAHLGDYSSS